jgi:hypothetical protein
MEPIEAAFFWGEYDEQFFARITYKCPICGRRNRVLKTGAGKLKKNLPIKVTCKLGHETLVEPYKIH